nr:PKD domain-containing protein [Bacteroidota bacterium]
YDVTLTVVNAFGSDTETKTAYITVTVLPLPNADFEASSTTIYAGESIGFTDLTTNGPTSWSWQFPGAEPQTALVQNPTAITYNSPGIYGVTLTATNIYGTDSEVKSGYITVNVLPVPVADFEVNFNSIEVGEPIDFTDLSTNSPTGWSWTFEGGTPTGSSDQNPLNIIYADEGAYDVQLTVTNQYGTDTKIKEDYIHVSYTPPVVADFTSDFTTIYQGEIIHFYDMSSGNPSFWIWNIDGASPTLTYQQNPVVIFNTPGIFNVKLTVSGINGSDVEIKEGYIEVIEILSIYPPGWNYEPTSSQHIIAIPVSANPRIFEVPVEPGDYLGVFYQEGNNQYRCGGAVAWDGSINVPIIAYGDEGFTPMKDGFTYGEEFIWKLYSFSQELEYTAIATYDPNQQNQGTFSPLGMSVTTDLFAGDQFELIIPQGWSGISSPVAPRDKDLGLLFAPISNNLELMYNYDGMFWPSSGVNTLIDWENKSGYNIKMAEESVFEFKGAGLTDISVQIQEGWNYIPVPVPCEVNVIPLFNSHLDDLIIVREISGFAVYWPEYNIKTLDHLVAGRAYMLMAQDGFNLEFSQCQGGLKTMMDIPVNNQDLTPCWDMINATADIHTIAVTGTALDVLHDGDVIGAFSANGICYGAAEYNDNSIGLSIFGDDPFSSEIDGFEIDERIEFKLYRPGQHLIFELETQFDPVAPNQGLFTSNGLSVIKGFKYDPAGIDPQKTGPVSIFPNPTTGIITVAGIEHSDRVFLMSVDGQEIKYVENPGDSNIILDLGKHQKGIYMIKIESSKTTTMHKVILQ